jgi:DNA-binding XRE family transcriptional regulator
MPNLSQILKEEMGRLAKREIKRQVGPLQGQLVELRRTARDQRRRIERLEKELARKVDRGRAIAPRSVTEDDDVRVHRGSVRKHRVRLGISQREMAMLLDVSPLTVSNWETEKTSPSGKNKLAFAELRTLGVRDVRDRLERLEEN